MGFPMKTIRKAKKKSVKKIVQRASITSKISDVQFFDTTIAFSTNSNIVQYIPLFLPQAGTGSASRYGDRTVLKSIQGTLSVTQGSAQAGTVYLRMILLWDNQPNSASPTGPAPLTVASITAFKNPDLSYRFKILRDWLVPVHIVGANDIGFGNDSNMDIIQKFYISNLNYVSQFVASAGAIADVASGALHLATVTNVVLTANDTPVINGTVRCTFAS